MPEPFPIEPEHVNDLRACVILIAAALDGLSDEVLANVEDLAGGTSEQVGALVVLDVMEPAILPRMRERVQRVLFFRRGKELFRQELADVDLGDPAVLDDLLCQSFASIPPDCFIALGFSGHGTGVFGSLTGDKKAFKKIIKRWKQSALGLSSPSGMHAEEQWAFGSLSSPLMLSVSIAKASMATIFEIRDAIKKALETTNRRRVNLLFADACFDAASEFWIELAPLTEVYLASELAEPLAGWPYREWLSSLPGTTTATDWAKAAVLAYEKSKKEQRQTSYSLSALGDPSEVILCLDAWSAAIRDDPAAARSLLVASPSVHPEGAHDLVMLADLLASTQGVGAAVRDASERLVAAFKGARIDFTSSPGRGIQGASLFVPQRNFMDPLKTRHADLLVSKSTQWDDLLVALFP